MQCFWTHGYRATSVQTLMQATGLAKSSLYGTLGDKDRVFTRCLARYRGQLARALEQRLAVAASGRDFIEQVLEGLAAEAAEPAPRGCLALNSASELGAALPPLSAEISRCIAGVAAAFRRAVRQGQADGSIASRRDPRDLAGHLVAHIAGVRILIKGGTADPEAVRRLNAIALEALA